jgi:hypothetical protein
MTRLTPPPVLTAVLGFLGVWLAPLRAEVEFTGILVTPASSLFALADRAAGTTSGWIGLQQTFGGYTVTAYDPKTDVLTLAKDGVKTELRLNAAKVQPAKLEIRGTINLTAGEKIEFERATLAFDEDNAFPLKNGVVLHLTPRRMPDGNLFFQASFTRPKPDGNLETLNAMGVVAQPGKAFSIQIGSRDTPENNLGFSFTPTAE